MSDIRFNQWLHQSGTGGVSQVASGAVGVGTTNPLADFYVRGDAQITGILTAGHIAMGSSITFGDGDRAYFGDGTDMQLYHNGTNSYIENGTNALNIKSYQTFLQNANGSEDYLKATDGYGVELYHNNNKRIETTGYGVTVFGEVDTTNLSISGITTVGKVNQTLYSPHTTSWATRSALTLFGNYGGGLAFNDNNNNGWVQHVSGSGVDFWLKNGAVGGTLATSIKATKGGSVELYENNTKVFETASFGVNIVGGFVASGDCSIADKITHVGDLNTAIRFPAADQISFETGGTNRLKIHTYSSNNHVELDSSTHLSFADNGSNGRFIYMGDANASSTGYMHLQPGAGSQGFGGGIRLYSHANSTNPGGVYIGKSLNSSGAIIFGNGGMTPSTEYARITSSGDVGISSTSPRARLDVRDANTGHPVILRVSADNATPYALVVGNDTHNTDANNGLAMWVGGSKTHHIQARTSETASENKLEIEAFETTIQTGSNMNQNFYFDSNGRLKIGTSTEGTGSGDNLTIADSGNMGMTLRSTSSNYCNIYFSDATSGTGEYEGYMSYNHATDSLEFATSHTERLRIKSDGKVVIGNPNGSGTGALTIYPNSITGNGRLDVYGGGDENSQTQARNEVIRIGRGDILDSYYHSIWSATGSGSSNSHFLKFYVSNGNAGATNQKEALSMNGHGHVTKANHPSFCARHQNGSGFDGDIIVLTRISTSWDVWNTGGHYSTTTGKFTAPVAGVYYFEGQLMTTGHSNGDNIQDMFSLESNRGRITYVRQRESYFSTSTNANGYYTNSCGSSVRLAAGDTVWLQRHSNQNWGYSNRYYSYFTGWLIG